MLIMIVTSWDGFKWHINRLNPHDHDNTVLRKEEYMVLLTLQKLANNNTIFVDIGAFIGYYSIRLAKQCKKVIAFEPNPKSYAILLENIKLNNINNIEVYNMALGDTTSKAYLTLEGRNSHITKSRNDANLVEIQVNKLDDLLNDAHIIKIDTEGYERKVLLGMTNLINKCKPTLIIEHHGINSWGLSDYIFIKKYLVSNGYVAIKLRHNSRGSHHIYHHKSKDFNNLHMAIACHWINHCIENIKNNKPWYLGIPYEWWWGMNPTEFFIELFNHIENEQEWFTKLT